MTPDTSLTPADVQAGAKIETPHGPGYVYGITNKPPWQYIVYTYRAPWGHGPGQFNVGADVMKVAL